MQYYSLMQYSLFSMRIIRCGLLIGVLTAGLGTFAAPTTTVAAVADSTADIVATQTDIALVRVAADTAVSAARAENTTVTMDENAIPTELSLDSCLAIARRQNKDIQRLRLEKDKAQQVKSQAFTKYFPQIKGEAFGYYALRPMTEVGVNDIENSTVRDLLITLYGNYGEALGLPNSFSMFQYGYAAGVTAVQPVYWGGKIVAGNRLAQLGVEAAELKTEMSERDLLEQVEESYWLVVGLVEKKATLASFTSLLDTAYHTVSVATEAGLALQTDLLEIELRQSEIARMQIQLDNGLSLAYRALLLSMGYTPSVDSVFPTLEQDSATTYENALFALPAVNTDHADSPESQLLAMQVKAAELRRRMAIADALPQVAVGAHYGHSLFQANLLKNGLTSRTGNGAVFVSVSVPLTAWWETGHKIKELSITKEQAELQQAHTDELLTLRIEQAYDKMQESYLLIQNDQRALNIAREHYRLSNVNYKAGTATITDLLLSQSKLLQAENDFTDAVISFRIAQRRYADLTTHD